MKAPTAVFLVSLALASAATDDRETAFMKGIANTDEDLDFWTRELAGGGSSRRRNNRNLRGNLLDVDEDVEFWTRELAGGGSSRRRERHLKKDTDLLAEADLKEDVEFWTRELGGSGRRQLTAEAESAFIEGINDEDVIFWTRQLGGSNRRD